MRDKWDPGTQRPRVALVLNAGEHGRSLTFVDENLPNLTREEHLYETPTKTNVI